MFDTKISLYAIMILLSLVANVIVVIVIHNKKTFNKDELIGALIYENIGIIYGAKILTYLEHIHEYEKFDFLKLGISSFGGLIGAIIMLTIFALQFKKNIKEMLLAFMPSIPLMYAIGKIGCFLSGCCHGIEYNGIFHVIYKYSPVANVNTPYFPVQIFESILFFGIFIYIIIEIKKEKFDLKSLGIAFIFSGLAKFSLDFLRISHVNKIISLNQLLCIIFIIVGLILINRTNKSRKKDIKI